jgi:DNA-binding transcriptional LysR family regulator
MPLVAPSLLSTLDVLLTERSVTRAARRLGVTQSAVSHQLRALRDAFDDPLVVASKQGLIPTARAEAMAAPLRQALHDLDAATALGATFDPRSAARTFRLSVPDYVELVAMPPLAAELAHEAPGIDLCLEPPYPDLSERLADGRLDLAIATALPLSGAIYRARLASEGFLVVLRRGHPAARGRWDLARYLAMRHVVIAPRGARGSVVDDALAARGLSRRVALRVASFAAAPFIAAASDLCLTAPTGLVAALEPRLAVVVRPPPLELPVSDSFIYWHARADRDPAQRWLRGQLLAITARRAPAGKVRAAGSRARGPRRGRAP